MKDNKIYFFPVMTEDYSKEEAPFIYTLLGEEKARSLNVEPRIAGTVACFCREVLLDGPTAQAWLKLGYIERR